MLSQSVLGKIIFTSIFFPNIYSEISNSFLSNLKPRNVFYASDIPYDHLTASWINQSGKQCQHPKMIAFSELRHEKHQKWGFANIEKWSRFPNFLQSVSEETATDWPITDEWCSLQEHLKFLTFKRVSKVSDWGFKLMVYEKIYLVACYNQNTCPTPGACLITGMKTQDQSGSHHTPTPNANIKWIWYLRGYFKLVTEVLLWWSVTIKDFEDNFYF